MTSLFIVQLGTRHKLPGPYWTGKLWSSRKEDRALYDLDTAINQANTAVKTAVRDVAVMDGDLMVFKRKPAQRGAYIADGNSFVDKKAE